MRNAVPNPLAVLTVANSFDLKRLAMSVAYTAVDSYNNYKRASENADMAFIMSGWELDDEEKETVMKNRDRAFDYMVDMVQEYHLDGLKTLNEKAIEKFAEISAIENASERIKLFRAEESQYSLLGKYWLELANAYFETEQYAKCLECIDEYNDLSTGIYRKDYNYLQILPEAIVSVQETYTGDQYVEKAAEYADAIIDNTSTDNWSDRYFAAQVYMDLYAKTNEQTYLDNAYKIASENVAVLLKEQRNINSTYLADVVEQQAVEPDYRYMTDSEKNDAEKEYKNEVKRVKAYNKALNRKSELPALYEPLVLNCELLFALADEIIIPANLLTSEAKVTVTVWDDGNKTIFDDCVVDKVKREGNTIDTFKTYITSRKMKNCTWTAASEVIVSIKYNDAHDRAVDFDFHVCEFEKHWYGDKVKFEAL